MHVSLRGDGMPCAPPPFRHTVVLFVKTGAKSNGPLRKVLPRPVLAPRIPNVGTKSNESCERELSCIQLLEA